jgi:hypothetical protein
MLADPGIVTIHAIPMFPATPQRTADEPIVVPTLMIAPVIVCVVEAIHEVESQCEQDEQH